MFREGQYLEVIKTSDGCVATAIVTIKEKTVVYKNKTIKTNKWMDLQDWVTLYGVIRKAITRNNESRVNGKTEITEGRKSTRHLEVTYKFEDAVSPHDNTSLPTIRITVKSMQKIAEDTTVTNAMEKERKSNRFGAQSSKKNGKSRENEGVLSENYTLEEYVPPAISTSTKANAGNVKYVPSRKSMLLRMRCSTEENKYTPTSGNRLSSDNTDAKPPDISYVPNSKKSLTKPIHETYDPCCATTVTTDLTEAYVPSSKGARTTIEEYEPDFASKTMKFDDSYVPSSTNFKIEMGSSRKRSRKSLEIRNKKSLSTRSLVTEITRHQP